MSVRPQRIPTLTEMVLDVLLAWWVRWSFQILWTVGVGIGVGWGLVWVMAKWVRGI